MLIRAVLLYVARQTITQLVTMKQERPDIGQQLSFGEVLNFISEDRMYWCGRVARLLQPFMD